MDQAEKHVEVIIIGAGLSGLRTAQILTHHGVQAKILEARSRIGGRMMTVTTQDGRGAFDLGPAWVWAEHTHVQQLARSLDIELFVQFESGEAVFDRGPEFPTQRFTPDWSQPPAHRFVGGVQTLSNRLFEQLPSECVTLDTVVHRINKGDSHLEIWAETHGSPVTYLARHVIVTLPPRLAVYTLIFSPALPSAVIDVMRHTQTWMGQALKVVLVYRTPFWRVKGLSGLGVSHPGPVDQFHDATPDDEDIGALFGWIGNNSQCRKLSLEARQATVIDQVDRMFGSEAGRPIHYIEHDWASDPLTTPVGYGSLPEQDNPRYGHPLLLEPQMAGRLHWAGAEVSPVGGGYLEGAVYSAEQVAKQVLHRL